MTEPPPSPLRSMHLVDWAGLAPREGLRLVAGVLVVLAGGLALGEPQGAAIAAGGALTAGFGAFQQFTRSRLGPMLFAVVGIAVATYLATYAGRSLPVLLLVVLVYGLWCGLLPAIGMGAFWIGLQCGVFLIVSSAYAALGHGLERALLVASGGLVEIACYGAILTIERRQMPRPSLRRVIVDGATALSGLRFHLRPGSPRLQFALRFAAVLAAAVAVEHAIGIPNGYWIAMTTLLLTRPDFQDTMARGLGRFIGTVAGAVGATLIAHFYLPSPPELAGLVGLFAALSFVSLRANYGLFSLWLTAYVVFLLVLAGLAEPQVALSRILSTAIGGGIAVLAHVDFFLLRRRAGAA